MKRIIGVPPVLLNAHTSSLSPLHHLDHDNFANRSRHLNPAPISLLPDGLSVGLSCSLPSLPRAPGRPFYELIPPTVRIQNDSPVARRCNVRPILTPNQEANFTNLHICLSIVRSASER